MEVCIPLQQRGQLLNVGKHGCEKKRECSHYHEHHALPQKRGTKAWVAEWDLKSTGSLVVGQQSVCTSFHLEDWLLPYSVRQGPCVFVVAADVAGACIGV